MEIIVARDYKELSDIACEIIEQQVRDKASSVLGLATGATPMELYKNMRTGSNIRGISYKDIVTINLDEYIGLNTNNINSYYAYMNKNLFTGIDIDKHNTHIPNGLATSIKDECERYETLLKNLGYADLQILGLGSNGHIGFNEPGTNKEVTTHCVKLDKSTRINNSIYFDDPSDMPTHAITMGIRTILKSKRILLLASGFKKASAVETLLKKEVTKDFPASYLWEHDNVTLLVDKEAYYGKSHSFE